MALQREAEPPNWWRIDLSAFTSSLRDPGVLFFFLIFFSLVFLLFVLVFYCFLRGGSRRRQGEPSSPAPTTAATGNNKGLDEEAVKSLREARYGSLAMVEGNECSICLGMFEDSEMVKVMPECSHVFHGGCVDTWLVNRSSCPLCRASLHSTSSSVHIDIIDV